MWNSGGNNFSFLQSFWSKFCTNARKHVGGVHNVAEQRGSLWAKGDNSFTQAFTSQSSFSFFQTTSVQLVDWAASVKLSACFVVWKKIVPHEKLHALNTWKCLQKGLYISESALTCRVKCHPASLYSREGSNFPKPLCKIEQLTSKLSRLVHISKGWRKNVYYLFLL